MKTRHYKTLRVGSNCRNNQGLAPYKRTELMGLPAHADFQQRDRVEASIYLHARSVARKADRVRRKAEAHLDWDTIREMLDAGLTLEQAKLESTY